MKVSVTADVAAISRPGPETWCLRPVISRRAALIVLLSLVLLGVSGHRTEVSRLATLTADAIAVSLGLKAESQVSDGLGRIVSGMFPLQMSETRDTSRIEGFDPDALPWGAWIEHREIETETLDPVSLQLRTTRTRQSVLVEPFGYLARVLGLMLETIEIAAWGTLIAIVSAIPLAYFGARNYSPHASILFTARGLSSFLRAVPELISALLLVLVFGFGPIAGVLALGLHAAGFLGKFFADGIENAAPAPQDALRAAGANKAKILRHAVLPEVLPAYVGYVQYVLERNIRTATVIGIVGAGGIGQELKGRFEMFDFAHVGTILVVIFVTVVAFEYSTGRLRARLV